LARRKDKLDEVAQTLRVATGKRFLPIRCDVTKTEDVKNAVEISIKEFGKVDILINNAGTNARLPITELSDEQWKSVIDLNLNAMFTCCREFGKEMIKREYGRIVNISSICGAKANSFRPMSAYYASKAGVINFTRAAAAEWAKKGINVNAIGPGFFFTELTTSFINTPEFKEILEKFCPMARAGNPKELNGALIYLVSDEATYTTGTTLFVDGGYTAV
jgi:gluconate 5-dehydrogenase